MDNLERKRSVSWVFRLGWKAKQDLVAESCKLRRYRLAAEQPLPVCSAGMFGEDEEDEKDEEDRIEEME